MPTRARTTCPRCRSVYTPGHGCPKCRARAQPARARRYGPRHRALRAKWAEIIDASNGMTCTAPTCDTVIRPGDPWHLGHKPGGGPDDYLGPLCVPCNANNR